MNAHALTPTIEVAIGRELRLYHAYVTTAPSKLDAPATLTLYAAPLSDVSGMAAAPIAIDSTRAKTPARLVLVDGSEFSSGNRRDTAKRSTCSSQPTRCSLE